MDGYTEKGRVKGFREPVPPPPNPGYVPDAVVVINERID